MATYRPGALSRLVEHAITETKVGLQNGLRASAQDLEMFAQTNVLRLSHPPGTPTPSAPGEPPATISGALAASIALDTTHFTLSDFSATVGSSIVYAEIQELGGDMNAHTKMMRWNYGSRAHFARHVRLPARPYLRPALDDVAVTLPGVMASELHAMFGG